MGLRPPCISYSKMTSQAKRHRKLVCRNPKSIENTALSAKNIFIILQQNGVKSSSCLSILGIRFLTVLLQSSGT